MKGIRPKKIFKCCKGLVLVPGLLLLFAIVFFFYGGTFLVPSDKLQKADAIVVLMGGIPERVPVAVDLFWQGYAPVLIYPDDFEANPPQQLPDGTLLHNDAAKSQHLSSQFGVPDSVVVIVPGQALNTQAEAELIAAYLLQHQEMDTIILVSSSYHMRRAGMIFSNELSCRGLEVEIIRHPSQLTGFDAQKWWKTKADRSTVYYEYLKMIYNLLWDRWF